MEGRGYNKSRRRSREGLCLAAVWAVLACGLSPLPAQSPEARETADATLLEVESIARKAETLDALGKRTLAQSVTILDLGTESLPALLAVLKQKEKDWKFRYWAADMVGYVGGPGNLPELLALARDETEKKQIRLRALDSVLEIARRKKSSGPAVRKALKKFRREIRNRDLRKKAAAVLKNIP